LLKCHENINFIEITLGRHELSNALSKTNSFEDKYDVVVKCDKKCLSEESKDEEEKGGSKKNKKRKNRNKKQVKDQDLSLLADYAMTIKYTSDT